MYVLFSGFEFIIFKGTHLFKSSPADPALLQLVHRDLKSAQDVGKNVSVEFPVKMAEVQDELQRCLSELKEMQQKLKSQETGE